MNSASGKTFPTINPATEEKIADIQEGDKVSCLLIIIFIQLIILTAYCYTIFLCGKLEHYPLPQLSISFVLNNYNSL